MTNQSYTSASLAAEDFEQARSRAKLEKVVARLSGRSVDLLSYEDVRKSLRASTPIPRGLQNIPISSIVGSVDRYADFSRSFLPQYDSDEGRWTRIMDQMRGPGGLPPIEVYQIGSAYFVLDGNHRVSVAKHLGADHIQAYVHEVKTRIPLSPETQPEDLILKAEYVEFLEHTRLDRLVPEADLSVTAPGQYQVLEEHISVHRYYMGIDEQQEIPYERAIIHWYNEVYSPVVEVIRKQDLLQHFPGRTEADLYLWIMEHRAELEQTSHWWLNAEETARDLIDRHSQRPERVIARTGERLSQAIVPEPILPGPPAGAWRQEIESRQSKRLFARVVVSVTGNDSGWYAVEQAIQVCQQEGGKLTGLHVVRKPSGSHSERVKRIEIEFTSRCKKAGVDCGWSVEVGSVAPTICASSRWAGLTVVGLNNPPSDRPDARWRSGFRTLIQHCPAPVLAVPQTTNQIDCALLAYDGSPKADEALFVSTYLAAQWQIPLHVLTAVESGQTADRELSQARMYLEAHGVDATFEQVEGPAGEAILIVAREMGQGLIVMGGYGARPVLEIAFGSTVDRVLRHCRQPVLICR